MKKLLYFFAILMITLSARAAESDNLTARLKVADDFNTASLSVRLNNSDSYVAFQMDIALPEGWMVEAGDPVRSTRLQDGGSIELEDGQQSTDFVISANVLQGNIVRVVAYNFGNHAIRVEAGELFSIQLTKTAGQAVTYADWKATFSNIMFVCQEDLEGIQLYIKEKTASQTVAGTSAPMVGDVNQDGIVNGNDLLSLLDIICNDYNKDNYSSDKYDLDAADLNDDQKWNGNDLVALLSLL